MILAFSKIRSAIDDINDGLLLKTIPVISFYFTAFKPLLTSINNQLNKNALVQNMQLVPVTGFVSFLW
jgi:hypothetical protein